LVVLHIGLQAQADLVEVAQARCIPAALLHPCERRQQDGREDGDDRNHHQKLNQRERAFRHGTQRYGGPPRFVCRSSSSSTGASSAFVCAELCVKYVLNPTWRTFASNSGLIGVKLFVLTSPVSGLMRASGFCRNVTSALLIIFDRFDSDCLPNASSACVK